MDYFIGGIVIGFGIMTYKSMNDIKKLETNFNKFKIEMDLKNKEIKKIETIKEILHWD